MFNILLLLLFKKVDQLHTLYIYENNNNFFNRFFKWCNADGNEASISASILLIISLIYFLNLIYFEHLKPKSQS